MKLPKFKLLRPRKQPPQKLQARTRAADPSMMDGYEEDEPQTKLTSAFIVRRGLSSDWIHTELPSILWLNTAVLLASSVALELARRALKSGQRESFNRLWTAGSILGVMFLAGQYVAWRQLSAQGIYLSTNPSSSFFYVLTAAHAVHLIGGVLALLYVSVGALRLRLGPGKRTAIDVTAMYWHFLDGLWIYLLILFLVWG